ncbi:MAG TPA: phage Gp37/Gp68 family protein [Lacunisphaera sp.]|nr:phage Gp37/Gp68 family protein [Lacunisphaera sp.]
MSINTLIEWCMHSLSPWWGCTKVSPGCLHCYMMTLLKRWKGGKHCGKGAPRLRIESFEKNALKLEKRAVKLGVRQTVFPSMCDPFDEEVPIEWFADMLDVIRRTPHLDWLLLTKRPENWRSRTNDAHAWLCHPAKTYSEAQKATSAFISNWWIGMSPENVWIGTSVEDQTRATDRIPLLLQIPARVRFLSCEPLLGAVDLNHSIGGPKWLGDQRGIDWVIVGGESGPGTRPMHPDWARSLRNQCAAEGVPFFFKQWGQWKPSDAKPVRGKYTGGGVYMLPDGRWGCQGDWWDGKATAMDRVGKKAAGRLLDGVEHNALPQARLS